MWRLWPMEGQVSNMTRHYTKCIERKHVTRVQTTCMALKGMLNDFVRDDKVSAIRRLNVVRPIDVIECVLGRTLDTSEGLLYLEALQEVPASLQDAFKLGKVWQDMKQGARKHLQGNTSETAQEYVVKFRRFLSELHAMRSRVS